MSVYVCARSGQNSVFSPSINIPALIKTQFLEIIETPVCECVCVCVFVCARSGQNTVFSPSINIPAVISRNRSIVGSSVVIFISWLHIFIPNIASFFMIFQV